jgi:hypothetical protein
MGIQSFFLFRFILVCFFLFFAPVPGAARVGHSGGNAKTRQYIFLQDNPEDQKTNQ